MVRRRVMKRNRVQRRKGRRMNVRSSGSSRKRFIVPKLVTKRVLYNGAWTMSTAATSGFWRYETFSAGNINNFAELAQVFDEYKINGIKVTYRPRYDNIDGNTAAAGLVQTTAHVVIDPDTTNTTPSGVYSAATLNGFLEQGDKVKSYTLNKPFSIYFKPKQLLSTPTGSIGSRPRFNKTTDTAVNYRGYHIFLAQNNMVSSNNQVILDQFITVYFSMRNLK